MKRVVLSCAALLLSLATAARAQSVGSAAPDFKLDNWINGTGEHSLSEFEGKVILMEIWATW